MQLIGDGTFYIINGIMNSRLNPSKHNLTLNVSKDEVLRIIITPPPKVQKPYLPVESQTF